MDFIRNKTIYIRPQYNLERGFRNPIMTSSQLHSVFVSKSRGVCGNIIYDGDVAYQDFKYKKDNLLYYIVFDYLDSYFNSLTVFEVTYDYLNFIFKVKRLCEFDKEAVETIIKEEIPPKTENIDDETHYNIVKSIQQFFDFINK